MKKYLLGIFAVLLAVSFSSFETAGKTEDDLVWFQLNAGTGEASDPLNGGVESDSNPFSCNNASSIPCAAALSIEDEDVEYNQTGYRIKTGVDITSTTYRDDYETKN